MESRLTEKGEQLELYMDIAFHGINWCINWGIYKPSSN
jgi:hypothetical protein